MKENIIQKKSYEFSIEIIKLYKYLTEQKKEYILAKQILRCGTSIGANIEEAIGGQTKKDFFTKFSIAYKEARETHYWLRLLNDSGYINNDQAILLKDKVEEILRLITAIQKTLRQNLDISHS